MPTIAIITDFGSKDGNVGVMKGIILGICPSARIVDVSHMIAPQNVMEATLILSRSAPYFPAGTVHLVVVDPGVGTSRRPIAARIGLQYFVGPDNGVVTLWLQRARMEGQPLAFVRLDQREYWRPDVSHVFHGRDIFAPVAAHLAGGTPLDALGSHMTDPVEIDFPKPREIQEGWDGEVVHIDHFGNVASNIRAEDLRGMLRQKRAVQVLLGSAHIQGLVNTFGEGKQGDLVALLGSTGNLIVSAVNGNAAERLGVRLGDPFRVRILRTGIGAQREDGE